MPQHTPLEQLLRFQSLGTSGTRFQAPPQAQISRRPLGPPRGRLGADPTGQLQAAAQFTPRTAEEILRSFQETGARFGPADPSPFLQFSGRPGSFSGRRPLAASVIESALIGAAGAGPSPQGILGGFQGLRRLLDLRAAKQQELRQAPLQQLLTGAAITGQVGQVQERERKAFDASRAAQIAQAAENRRVQEEARRATAAPIINELRRAQTTRALRDPQPPRPEFIPQTGPQGQPVVTPFDPFNIQQVGPSVPTALTAAQLASQADRERSFQLREDVFALQEEAFELRKREAEREERLSFADLERASQILTRVNALDLTANPSLQPLLDKLRREVTELIEKQEAGPAVRVESPPPPPTQEQIAAPRTADEFLRGR